MLARIADLIGGRGVFVYTLSLFSVLEGRESVYPNNVFNKNATTLYLHNFFLSH